MDFRLLGPVQAREGERVLPAGSGRERFVLAVLLLHAGRLTRADQLIDALWDEPPPSAKAQLHNSISRWRRRLCADGLIVTRPLGYELRLGPHRLDVADFRRLAAEGRHAAGQEDHERAVALFSQALSLWRGPALADVPDELASSLRQPLEEEKVAAAEAFLASELSLGRYDDVLRGVLSLIDDHPFRERLYEFQMMALVGVGRRVDALDTYQQVYRRLATDLGVEPGPSLRNLERQILEGETPVPASTVTRATVPRQLPPVIATLSGRDSLIGEICGELRNSDDARSRVVALVGPGGVGKTALALAVGHGSAEDFTGGQLFADLHGSHCTPVDSHVVTGRFLRALGVDGAQVPDDRDERTAMYRSELATRRILLVLDDVSDEAQVRPLLPGTPSSGVLITSRQQLSALLGTRYIVPMLATQEALDLLARVIGQDRVIAELDAAAAIVETCGHLPLAVSIVAARLATRPDRTLAELRERLAEERGRLDELALGDLDVRASIALSYQALDPTGKRLFRRLGLTAAGDWPSWVADQLLGEPAGRLIDQLVDVHLVEPQGLDALGQHRFRLHDLVHDFASERVLAEEPPADQRKTSTRVLSGWLALASEADDRIDHGLIAGAGLPTPAVPIGAGPSVHDMPETWLETERRNLTAAVDQACRSDQAEIAGRLALRLSGFLALRAYYDDWEHTLRAATACVRQHGPDDLLLRLLGALCVVCRQRSRNADTAALAAEELSLARRLGDRYREIGALGNAGWAARKLGRLAEALDWLEQAVAACDPQTPSRLVSRALNGLAMAYREVDQAKRALPLVERALAIERLEASPRIVSICLQNYAATLLDAGRPADAERALVEAMSLTKEIGDEQGSAVVEDMLASVNISRGRWKAAEELLDRSLRSAEKRGDLSAMAEVSSRMGDLATQRGRPREAVPPLRRSLAIWRRLDAPVETARVLARLDRSLAMLGNSAAAAEHRREWQAIITELQLDESCLRVPPPPSGARR